MKKLLLLLVFILTNLCQMHAADSEWIFYVYSESGINTDLGTFQTTSDSNIFKLKKVAIPTSCESGFNFMIRKSDWTGYGWGTETIATTGVAYGVATATQATGWCTLAAGDYDITFNLSDLTIRFDVHSDISYVTYPDGHAMATVDDYLRGGDISMLNYVESMGTKFYDANGTEKDALDIMQENGVNFVRLRLYNNPGQTVTYTPSDGDEITYALPAGFLDEEDVLNLARRAKAHNMKIELTFHYSDFWTNGEMQFKPKGWENYDMDELKQAIHDYTYAFLQRMNAQGTTPDYVSLGNEIQSGLLFGYYTTDKKQVNTVNGYASNDNMANIAALLNSGSTAVRSACPDAKIVIHLTLSTNITSTTYQWFFDKMTDNSLDYDIIGASYYPYWTNQKPTMVDDLATAMYTRYGKDLLIMEAGYSWTQYRPSDRYGADYEGQLHVNGTAYDEATESGQKSFIQELQSVVKGNDHILGYLYWDPVMVEQQVDGSWIKSTWAMKKSDGVWYEDGNQVGNTTWFDYEGKALPALEAVAEDMITIPTSVEIDNVSYIVETEAPYVFNIGATGYATFYDGVARTLANGLTAYTVQEADNTQLNIKDAQLDIIPAGCGILLHGNEGTYYLWPRYDNNASITGNMLYGTIAEQTISEPTGSYTYYKLANDAINGLGWYWGAKDGGAFTIGAHKAYLAVPQSQAYARNFLPLSCDESTSIKAMQNRLITNSDIYDMQGRRLFRPIKGIYITNGKKVVNK